MTADEARPDPFLAARFRVTWDGRAVPGVIAVSRLAWTLQEDPDESLAARPDSVRLERERSADDAFEAWAELARRAGPGGRGDVRERATKDVVVELLGSAAGALRFILRGCTPQTYVPVCGLDADSPEAAREALVLDCEHIEPSNRDGRDAAA